jgi:hypothetical protein
MGCTTQFLNLLNSDILKSGWDFRALYFNLVMSVKVSLWKDPALWSSLFSGPVITFDKLIACMDGST